MRLQKITTTPSSTCRKWIATTPGPDLGQHVSRNGEGDARLRHERRSHWAGLEKNIDALKKADWLVVGEIYPDETSEFWRVSGSHARGNEDDQDRRSIVWRVPVSPRKTGSMTNSARWLQWKNTAVPTPGDARSRSGHRRANFSQGARALPEGRRQISRPDSEPDMALYERRSIPLSGNWPRS